MRTEVIGLTMYSRVSADGGPADAPVIVLVHGPGLSGRYMVPTARELAGYFHVYVPDMLGYGESGDPGAALGIPQLAGWLDAWMGAVGLTRARDRGSGLTVEGELSPDLLELERCLLADELALFQGSRRSINSEGI